MNKIWASRLVTVDRAWVAVRIQFLKVCQMVALLWGCSRILVQGPNGPILWNDANFFLYKLQDTELSLHQFSITVVVHLTLIRYTTSLWCIKVICANLYNSTHKLMLSQEDPNSNSYCPWSICHWHFLWWVKIGRTQNFSSTTVVSLDISFQGCLAVG